MCCLELLVDESSAEHVLADTERIEHVKRTMRISTETTHRIKASVDQRKPQSVLKQLLKRKPSTVTALCPVAAKPSAQQIDMLSFSEKPFSQQQASNLDAASLIRAVMSCPWPEAADERPGSAHLLAVAHAIGWDMAKFDERTDLAAELRRRYRLACLLCHPDKCSEPGCLQAFLRVQATSDALDGILSNLKFDFLQG